MSCSFFLQHIECSGKAISRSHIRRRRVLNERLLDTGAVMDPQELAEDGNRIRHDVLRLGRGAGDGVRVPAKGEKCTNLRRQLTLVVVLHHPQRRLDRGDVDRAGQRWPQDPSAS